MAQDFLPPDYQEELDAAARRRALAQLMLQRGMQRPESQMVSGIYVPPSWTQHLAGLANTLSGQIGIAQADRQVAAVRRRFAENQAKELDRVFKTATGEVVEDPNNVLAMTREEMQVRRPGDPLEAERIAMQSQYPAVQALGKALAEQRAKREMELLEQQNRREIELLRHRLGLDAAMRGKLADRVRLDQVPAVYSGQIGEFIPRPEIDIVNGVPVRRDEFGYQVLEKPKHFQERVGDKEVLVEETPIGTRRPYAGDSPNVRVTTNVTNYDNKLVPEVFQELRKTKVDLQRRAQTIPQLAAVADAVKKGIIQGSFGNLRYQVLDFARLVGLSTKELSEVLDRTGNVKAVLDRVVMEFLKQYGTNPSNVDLQSAMAAIGSLDQGPQTLYMQMQLAQAMIYNAIADHQQDVANYAETFRQAGYTTRMLNVEGLPKPRIDPRIAWINPETGRYTTNFERIKELPKQGLFGPKGGNPPNLGRNRPPNSVGNKPSNSSGGNSFRNMSDEELENLVTGIQQLLQNQRR